MQSDELEAPAHDTLSVHWLQPEQTREPADVRLRSLVQQALERPVGMLPLADTVSPSQRVTIAFDPADIECPNGVIVPAVLDELAAAGAPDANITLLLAYNMRSFDREMRWASVPTIPNLRIGIDQTRYKLVQHDPYNVEAVNQLGVFKHVPLAINFHAVEADLLIATGSVNVSGRHARLTGSAHTVAVGCASLDTINALFDEDVDHIADEDASLDGAFTQAVNEAAQRAGLAFAIECSGVGGDAAVVRAGNPLRVHEIMTEIARLTEDLTRPTGARGKPAVNPYLQPRLRPQNAVKSKPATVMQDDAQ